MLAKHRDADVSPAEDEIRPAGEFPLLVEEGVFIPLGGEAGVAELPPVDRLRFVARSEEWLAGA
jgi:hypothetical protein